MMRSGFTLLEIAVVVAVIGVMVAAAIPSYDDWATNQRLRSSAAEVSTALTYARSEATRTGNVHLVLFQQDAQLNPLSASPILVVNDGLPGTTDQNCAIDTGEPTTSFSLGDDVDFGTDHATGKVSGDPGASTITSGSTFEDAGGGPATWVFFRPEGMPLAFSSNCTTGSIGSGGGGIYLTNGERDVAVVLTPLGAAHVHRWNAGASSWSN